MLSSHVALERLQRRANCLVHIEIAIGAEAPTEEAVNQAIQHIDVLNGNSNKTRILKEKLEQPESADYLAEAIDEIIALLKEHSTVIENERAITQNFLGDLRSRLSGVEEAIFSVITDGDD